MADIEKVIKGLEHCGLMYSDSPFNPCYECPYKGKYDCAVILKREALELLKEQRKIVQCKDCKNRDECEIVDGCIADKDWFCADGERRQDDD